MSAALAVASILGKCVVWIAVQPTLPRLRRRDHGVRARARVLAGVPVRRVVATERRAALLAGPEMDPRRGDLHALTALPALRVLDGRDRPEIRARPFWHRRHPPIRAAPCVRRRPRSIPLPPPTPRA